MKIGLEKIKQGVELSKEKCIQHLRSAEVLASNDLASDAIVHLEFGLEEFGRAIVLNENLKNSSENVDDRLQTDHYYKYDKAWTVLPEKLKTIYKGTFDPGVFDPRIFDAGEETISPRTRIEATFVHYDEKAQEWKTGIRVDPEKIFEIAKQTRGSIGAITWY